MPYIVSPNPAPRTGFGDFTENFTPYIDMLFQAMLAGQLNGTGPFAAKNIPNPGYGQMGQMGSPGTQFSQAGANPNPLAPPSTARYQPPIAPSMASPYAGQKMLSAPQFDQLIKSQMYQKGAMELDPNSLENQLLRAKIKSQQDGTAYFNFSTGQIEYSQPKNAKGIPGTGETNTDELGKALALLSQGTETGTLAPVNPAPLKSLSKTATPKSSTRIKVRSRDGKVGTVSSDVLEEALNQGYSLIE